MLEKTRGIVLKSIKYSETSLISKVFTEKFGVLSFMVPGIRSSKNRRGNILQSGQLLELDFYHRENKNFQRFKEYKVSYIPINTYADIKRASVQTFLIELSLQLVKEGEENNELFEHLYDNLIKIDREEVKGMLAIEQLLSISKILGFYPSNNADENSGYFNIIEGNFQAEKGFREDVLDLHTSSLMQSLLNDYKDFKSNERKILLDTLLLYFQHHIPNFRKLRSLDILGELVKLG
ncbi:MAG: DNA repair protein RecO [Bacteroidetes bacterium]|nr:DNA repair protein RecO [Bacteroidota bacterium]